MPAQKQTEKSRYESVYSPDKYVTGAQYICELICEKRAKQDGVSLGLHFWRKPEWAKFYKWNMLVVRGFLKQYDERAIIKTLKESGKWWSLRSDIMKMNMERHNTRILAEDKIRKEKASQQKPVNRATIDSRPRQRQPQRNKLSVLLEIDEANDGKEKDGDPKGT